MDAEDRTAGGAAPRGPSIDGRPLEDRTAASSRGSMKVGPSDDYKALLRGEITPEEYVRRLKAEVDSRIRRVRFGKQLRARRSK